MKRNKDCWKCKNKIVQTDIQEEHNFIHGCKLIPQDVWNKEGNKACPKKDKNNA